MGHSHESDHLALVIRNDRDLIDLFAMTHVLLSSVAEKGGADESLKEVIKDAENRMRKALKVNALYAKLYTKGAGELRDLAAVARSLTSASPRRRAHGLSYRNAVRVDTGESP